MALLTMPAALAAPTEKAVRFTETHYFTGLNELTVAKDGVRLVNKGHMRFIVVSKAPDWKVNVYRDDDKTFFSESLQQFEDTGLLSGMLVGKKARFLPKDPNSRESTFPFCGYNVVRITRRYETFKFLPLTQVLNAAPQVESIVYAMHKMPTNGGIPISYIGVHTSKEFMSSTDETGSRQEYFDTKRIEPIMVSPHIFDVPAGYRKAASVREVVSGSVVRGQSEDLFRSLERGSQPK